MLLDILNIFNNLNQIHIRIWYLDFILSCLRSNCFLFTTMATKASLYDHCKKTYSHNDFIFLS